MNSQMTFIDRIEELAVIDNTVAQWGVTNWVFISGNGGIGKTRLVQEIRRLYTRSETTHGNLSSTEIIDFDDLDYHLPQNIGRKIAEDLGESHFTDYLDMLSDLKKMERAGVSQERQSLSALEADRAFVECFNILSTTERILILIDTIEVLDATDTFAFLLEMGKNLQNCVIFLSGRTAKEIGEASQKTLEHVVVIDLKPLSDTSSEFYLLQKQDQLHINIEQDLAQKLLLLAGGKPIIIDLAVEWRAHGISLAWLSRNSLDELKQLSAEEIRQKQIDFERHLVMPIAETRQNIDWLVLVMARIYPLNVEMISNILALPLSDAQTLFDKARGHVFVKELPNGMLTLHDEMRRMVREYVWPEVDPDGDRQQHDSNLAITYFDRQINQIEERIRKLRASLETDEDYQHSLKVFLEQDFLERQLWVYKGERLDHSFFIDVDIGMRTFVQMFDEATSVYRFSERGRLVNQAMHYYSQLAPVARYELESRRAKYLLDDGSYERARDLVTEILVRTDLTPEQRIDMLIQGGNAEIRLGYLAAGIADFEQAVHICRTHDLKLFLMRALNARGWAQRSRGDLSKALEDYIEASELSEELGDHKGMASVLNNIAYVYALLGKRHEAFEKCNAALDLWQELDFGRGLGATYSNLGEIYKRFDHLNEALEAFNEAFSIFSKENDIDWLSTVRSGRASVYWMREDFEKASDDLDWVLANGPANHRPRAIYYQGLIKRSQGLLDEAYVRFELSRKVSQEIGDLFFDYVNFSMLVDLALDRNDFARWRTLVIEHDNHFGDLDDEIHRRLRGTTLRKLADMALCNNDFEDAIALYGKALPLIATSEVRGQYLIGEQIKKTYSKIQVCVPPNVIQQLGRELEQIWKAQPNLSRRYPEVALKFRRWAQEGITT